MLALAIKNVNLLKITLFSVKMVLYTGVVGGSFGRTAFAASVVRIVIITGIQYHINTVKSSKN
jgi:hypothetical protein